MTTDQTHAAAKPTAPRPEGRGRRWLRAAHWAVRRLRHSPVTLVYAAALWIIGLVTGSLLHGPSAALLNKIGGGLPALADGRWWTVLTSGLWASSLGSYLGKTVLILLLVAPAERRIGAARTALILVVSQVGGSLLGAGIIKLGDLVGEPWLTSIADELDVGPATGAVGVGLALTCTMTTLWRRRIRLFLLVGIFITMLYIGHVQEVVRMAGGLVGLGAGLLMFGRAAGAPRWRASHHETRILVALAVAASALGAIVAAFSENPNGPLEPLSFLVAATGPDPETVREACTKAGSAGDCRAVHAEQLYDGLATFLALAPALLLLVIADGLRRGRRFAWRLGLVVHVILLALAVWLFVEAVNDPSFDWSDTESNVWYFINVAEALLPWAGIVVLLLFTRRHFDQRADRTSWLRLTELVGGALVLVSYIYVHLGYLIQEDFRPEPTLPDLIADLPTRFLAPAYLDLLPTRFLPHAQVARFIYVYLFMVFWVVALAGLLAFFWRGRTVAQTGAAERARRILTSGSGSTLSYMTTWPGNRYWFNDTGDVAVAYREIGGVAVTVGDPYGEETARAGAVRGFADFCSRRGVTPCFYSVTPKVTEEVEALGWSAVQVAEDTVVPLPELAFKGKKWQDVRTALNKAGKAGITAQWWTYENAPVGVVQQINAISEEWVADKGLPEMGFTLGGLDELKDRNVRCLVAVDADGEVHGVTSWMPVYRGGATVGWTLDFMRRRTDDAFRGVMEFLIASAALTLKDEGAEFLSLSGAPLARLDRGDQPGALQRLLDLTGRLLEPVYGFRSLFAFKAKFQPVYQPLYMAYPDPAALPAIANAIGRAYVPNMTAGQAIRLLAKLRD
jgi:phosphatidylglycerol lysyltransferase